MDEPSRSLTDRRYESVDTNRSAPSSSAAINTPVKMGRESSDDADLTTWLRASRNSGPSKVTAGLNATAAAPLVGALILEGELRVVLLGDEPDGELR